MSAPVAAPVADGPINRTLRVLTAVCEHGPATLTELSAATDLTPSTVLRMLRLMQDDGFATQVAGKRWRATFRLWQLGCAVNESVGLLGLTDRVLRDLATSVGETAVYAAHEAGSMTYTAVVAPDKPVRSHVRLGGVHGLLETRTGRAVLANLSREDIDRTLLAHPRRLAPGERQVLYRDLLLTSRRGYAAGVGELWPGVWAAAAPVLDARARPVGAIGVSAPVGPDGRCANAEVVVAEVIAAARRLSVALGGPERPPVAPLAASLAPPRRRSMIRTPEEIV
jgi:DNA-binding IclR family transcriptional regulator